MTTPTPTVPTAKPHAPRPTKVAVFCTESNRVISAIEVTGELKHTPVLGLKTVPTILGDIPCWEVGELIRDGLDKLSRKGYTHVHLA